MPADDSPMVGVVVSSARIVSTRHDYAYAEYLLTVQDDKGISEHWIRWRLLSHFEKTLDEETRKGLPPFPNKLQWMALRLTGWATDNAHLKRAFLRERTIALHTYFTECAEKVPRELVHFLSLVEEKRKKEERRVHFREGIPTADATPSTTSAMAEGDQVAPVSPTMDMMATKLAELGASHHSGRVHGYVAAVVLMAAVLMGALFFVGADLSMGWRTVSG